MTTITAIPDAETGSITLDILKTNEVTKIVRVNVNGIEEVRASDGQIPSPPVAATARTNLIINPSFETGTTGYTLMPTIPTTLTNPTTGGKVGSRHARITTTYSTGTDAFYVFGLWHTLNLTGGKSYIVSFYGRGSNGVVVYQPDVYAAGVYINNGANYSSVEGDWTRKGKRFTVSGTGTKSVDIGFGGYFDAGPNGGGTPVGSYIDIDGVIIEEAPTPVGMPAYFDGATPDITGLDYAWTGTANASTSTLSTLGGRLILTDYEAAHGSNTYNVYTADGSFVTTMATLELDKPWLSIPVMPQYSEQVESITSFGASREAATTVHRPLGRADSLVVMGKLGTRTGNMEIFCRTYAEARKLERVFERGEIVQLRQRVEGMDMYFTVTSIPVSPYSVQGETETRWAMNINYVEVRRPIGFLAGALGWTFEALAADFTSFDEVSGAFLDFDALTLGDVNA